MFMYLIYDLHLEETTSQTSWGQRSRLDKLKPNGGKMYT
jgi:hypothetical protein